MQRHAISKILSSVAKSVLLFPRHYGFLCLSQVSIPMTALWC